MPSDLILLDVVDGELLDEFGPCESAVFPYGPGGPAPFTDDPFDGDVGNTVRKAFLHDVCARQRAADI